MTDIFSLTMDNDKLKKQNVDLRQANASKFAQLEALKKQVNDFQAVITAANQIEEIIDLTVLETLDSTGVDECLKLLQNYRVARDKASSLIILKETQAAAQRILDKNK